MNAAPTTAITAEIITAEIIAVGSELLTPHRADTNSLFLTEHLNSIGVDVAFKTIVGDDRARLTQAIALAWRRSRIVITSGGLGPTEDDLTREAAAAALRRSLLHDEALARTIEARFRARGMRMPQINLRQASRIEGAEILPNTAGTAPGQWLEQHGRHGVRILMLLPGPPRELQPMFLESCLRRLREAFPGAAIGQRVLRLTGLAESAAEEIAAPIYTRFTNPVTTILAAPGEIQLHLKSFGKDDAEAQARLGELFPQLEAALADYIFSDDGAGMEEVAGRALAAQQATLAVAESCTGGLLAQRITGVSGSSAYFLGGVVCYSNEWKQEWLGVPQAALEAHGAVSAEVAQALAEGVRRRAAATYGIGITGIAGPSGGTPEKPVGLVYVALAGPLDVIVQKKNYYGERKLVRWQATQTALDMLRRALASARKSATPSATASAPRS